MSELKLRLKSSEVGEARLWCELARQALLDALEGGDPEELWIVIPVAGGTPYLVDAKNGVVVLLGPVEEDT